MSSKKNSLGSECVGVQAAVTNQRALLLGLSFVELAGVKLVAVGLCRVYCGLVYTGLLAYKLQTTTLRRLGIYWELVCSNPALVCS